MPELPEVETVACQLSSVLKDCLLLRIEIFDSKLLSHGNTDVSGTIHQVYREGKQIILEVASLGEKSIYCCFHLRMTGRFFWREATPPKVSSTNALQFHSRHVRAKLIFQEGELFFVDPRRFGTFQTSDTPLTFRSLGIDPLSPAFSIDLLTRLFDKKTQAIKHWLLRQDALVGIGNIYASEILFEAGIDPERKIGEFSTVELRRLYQAIKRILHQAIKYRGTTFSDFYNASGEKGSFQTMLRVYNRESSPCKRCKTPIKRIIQGSRSTFYCSQCQS